MSPAAQASAEHQEPCRDELHRMFDTIPESVLCVDRSGMIAVFNREAEQAFGYRFEELIGRSAGLILKAPVCPPVPSGEGDGWEVPADAMRTGGEMTGHRKDGSVFPVVVKARQTHLDTKPLITCLVRDISDRKAKETALRKNIARVSAILETIPNAIVTTSSEGSIESFNLASEPMFQYTPEEVIGRNIALLLPELGLSIGALESPPGLTQLVGQEREMSARRKDGTLFPVELAVGDISIEGQRLLACVVRDVSARKSAEEEARAARDQLIQTEKLASLGALVAGVAHEINTPVGISVTAASHLGEQTQEIEKHFLAGSLTRSGLRDYVDRANQATRILMTNLRRASELIQSFKQVAIDQSSSEPRTFNLKEYVEEVLLSLRPQLKKHPHTILLECDESLTITSRPGALSQILTNLVVNSLSHAYPGSRTGTLSTRIRLIDDMVELVYSDDGDGIPRQHLPRIFDPFFTTKRGQGGSGLGLHIVHNLVATTLGGTITCHSEAGRGTEFRILFPVIAGAAS